MLPFLGSLVEVKGRLKPSIFIVNEKTLQIIKKKLTNEVIESDNFKMSINWRAIKRARVIWTWRRNEKTLGGDNKRTSIRDICATSLLVKEQIKKKKSTWFLKSIKCRAKIILRLISILHGKIRLLMWNPRGKLRKQSLNSYISNN